MACGVLAAIVLAMLGLCCIPLIEKCLAHVQQTTEWGDAVLGIYAFMTFGATGFIAGFSSAYGIARRSGYAPLVITSIVLSINIVRFFVPTGGYAMLPFYVSVAVGLGLTVVFLILRSAPAKS